MYCHPLPFFVTCILFAGEFGIVYKAHLIKWHGNGDPKIVAVKTLKGVYRNDGFMKQRD